MSRGHQGFSLKTRTGFLPDFPDNGHPAAALYNTDIPLFCIIDSILFMECKNMNIFESGTVYIKGERLTGISSAQWIAHPKFAGVFTKNLLPAERAQDR
jgi:hypothetical protein